MYESNREKDVQTYNLWINVMCANENNYSISVCASAVLDSLTNNGLGS